MDLNNALSIATSGLEGTQYALGVLSQNVSNASTTGYVEEVANLNSADTTGTGSGVSIGLTTRNVNNALQGSLYTQNASVAALTVKSNSLSAITALQGSTSSDSGSSATLSDEVGNLSNAITSLISTPSNATARSNVISNAQALTASINTLSSAYQSQRQAAQDSIVTEVSSVNTDLTTIGVLSKQIMSLKVQGMSTADLENQRAAAMSDLSSYLSVTYTETSKGDMLVKTADGTQLPTYPKDSNNNSLSTYPTTSSNSEGTSTLEPSSTWPLTTDAITLTATSSITASANSSYIPAITLVGSTTDLTSHLTGGQLGANIDLRDNVYPKMQAQLDSFSSTLATRFNDEGVALFTDSSGNVPGTDTTSSSPSGIVGFSSVIQVSATLAADPSPLSENGSTDTAQALLQTALGAGSPTAPSSGLGVNGNISTGYNGSQTLANLATSLTSAQAQVASSVTASLTTATSVQSSLTTKVSNVSGVNVDNEMSHIIALQNAYTANAKIITAVKDMFTALLNAV
ncbi:flagellar hook-associated protein FlgK [Acetobacter sp.]|jgi:flagellar hook-associated protein 1 FlgK|uniref:flagellar hook-associated protein FlgK n=1 Tax=Acetobacter sp. TaxID=440 RepID=UPI0025C13081|nr:flagellar hook-associated protein FlgK [Acetobacter sp.]MCH4089929.1 flagellar hook-associated protein FlgK [Acetobacter sp.]MCI1298625.1 flagellar hook-associated protein FlgK [Acetobacter sp.]MCI1315190.1 flagellar hook-associated protein FlgK [Acetobacter sp.]